MISNRVDNTQFMILSESIIQDGGDGVLHRFIWANQKSDSETIYLSIFPYCITPSRGLCAGWLRLKVQMQE